MAGFGFLYPPGCSGPPEHPEICAICGLSPDDCVCPVCAECECVGDPDCYTDHGMELNDEQLECRAAAESRWRAGADGGFFDVNSDEGC